MNLSKHADNRTDTEKAKIFNEKQEEEKTKTKKRKGKKIQEKLRQKHAKHREKRL